MTKSTSLFTLSSLALATGLMASPPPEPAGFHIRPVAKPAVEAVASIAICQEHPDCAIPTPVCLLKHLKDMEANGDAIESILNNEKLKTPLLRIKTPIMITSMEDAVKYLTRASVEKINIDFHQQQLAIFIWQGSGQDRLRGHLSRGMGAAAQFHYIPGHIEDLRIHSMVYSMPKGTEMKVYEQLRMRCGVGEIEPQELNVKRKEEPLKLDEAPQEVQLMIKPQIGE